MSAPPPKGKQGGWGSFLSGAVAGLESRLDNMLADEDKNSARSKAQIQEQREDAAAKVGLTPEQLKAQDDARARSRNRVNARLQDRLAKAVANKGQDGSREGSVPSVGEQSAQRTSVDSKRSEATTDANAAPAVDTTASEKTDPEAIATEESKVEQAENTAEEQPPSTLSTLGIPDADSARPSQDSHNRPSIEASSEIAAEPATASTQRPSGELETELAQIQKERDEEAKLRQQEMHEHMERIDALQSKLQYLARQAAETAKQAKGDAAGGSLEKKLAEKDEQIALLMEEGQTLSKTELRLQNSLKQIRSKRAEDEKSTTELRKRLEKAEKAQQDAVSARQKANAKIKEQDDKLKIVAKIEKDVGELTREKEQSLELVRDLRQKLAEAVTRADEAEQRAQSHKLEAEKKKSADLQDELDNAKIERKLLEDRLKADLRDSKIETVKAREQSKLQEVELKSEITNLETQLELLRSQTEEASSGGTSESQAKLLRQIETLQTQYALARENWQGIEGTLNTRVATLEKERDDIAKREGDIRKKARELNTKARKQEEELESTQERARTLEQDLQEQASQVEKLHARANQAETSLTDAHTDFERQKKVWDAELQQRLEEEKTKFRLEVSSSHVPLEDPYTRNESPLSHHQRKASNKDLGVLNHPGARRSPSFRDQLNGTHSRRSSIHPQNSASLRTPDGLSPRQLSASSLHQLNGDRQPALSIDATLEETSSLAGMETPATGTSSPRHRENSLGANATPMAELMSVSTINAGPSVQLVERMSAAVRRLESEKAALKDEMSRLSSQRDEAREEVVLLMREGETWKEKDVRLNSLEGQVKELENKYEGALEVLGERQEKCDELVQDVADLKDMLRSMAEERASKK